MIQITYADNIIETHRFLYCPKCTTPLVKKILFDDNISRVTCPECGWIQLLNSAIGVAVLAHRGDQIAVIEPPGEDGIALPAGLVEYNENPQDAAVREVLEETGLDARIVAELGWIFVEPDVAKADNWPGPMIQFMYEAEIIGGELRGSDEGAARLVDKAPFPPIASGRTGSRRIAEAYFTKTRHN